MPKLLVLVPTQLELACIESRLADALPRTEVQTEVCGFGLVAAAARTGALLHVVRAERVILVGVAGAYDERLELEAAYLFDHVGCYGIGAGSGATFQTVGELGWHHWPNEPLIGDVLPIDTHGARDATAPGQLLSCCAASDGERDAKSRLKKFPEAVAEDMEGFAVAAACRMARVPISIVRGISNRAGDRDHRNWKIESAMEAAVGLVNRVFIA